jgi:hypothetical protein
MGAFGASYLMNDENNSKTIPIFAKKFLFLVVLCFLPCSFQTRKNYKT